MCRASTDNLRRNADAYLYACLREESPPHVGELARQLGMARFTLARQFFTQYGVELSAYFKHQQLAEAKFLLATTQLPIATIARRTGFGTERSFYRAFLQRTRMTPGAYRRACHNVSPLDIA